MWIVVYTYSNEDGLHYVGPFQSQLSAALWESIFLRDNPYNYTTQVCELIPPKAVALPMAPF